jgi:gliding motility-associated lipoprotein GldH
MANRYFCIMNRMKAVPVLTLILWVLYSFGVSSCTHIDLYEKEVAIPRQQWDSKFKPSFTFTITDTTSPYQLFLLLRHTEKYNYNNLWIAVTTKIPGSDSTYKAQYEVPLATNERGWLATGMDDIYEHRIALTPPDQKFYFRKKGIYTFTVEQVMREDPLEHILNVGLRIEKKPEH